MSIVLSNPILYIVIPAVFICILFIIIIRMHSTYTSHFKSIIDTDLKEYNDLMDDYNKLIDEYNQLVQKYETDIGTLQSKNSKLQADYDEIEEAFLENKKKSNELIDECNFYREKTQKMQSDYAEMETAFLAQKKKSNEMMTDYTQIAEKYDFYHNRNPKMEWGYKELEKAFLDQKKENELDDFLKSKEPYKSRGHYSERIDWSLIDGMEGKEFEEFCKTVLIKNGFIQVVITPGSNDFGGDITATKDGVKYVIQCKRYAGSVGEKAVQEVLGSRTIYRADVGIVLTNSQFTSSARKLAFADRIRLWDREKLAEMIVKASSVYLYEKPIVIHR